jgi:hypothetical protein
MRWIVFRSRPRRAFSNRSFLYNCAVREKMGRSCGMGGTYRFSGRVPLFVEAEGFCDEPLSGRRSRRE